MASVMLPPATILVSGMNCRVTVGTVDPAAMEPVVMDKKEREAVAAVTAPTAGVLT